MIAEFEIIEGLTPSKYLKEMIEAVESNKETKFVAVNTKTRFVSYRKDPNYDLPLSNLEKEY